MSIPLKFPYLWMLLSIVLISQSKCSNFIKCIFNEKLSKLADIFFSKNRVRMNDVGSSNTFQHCYDIQKYFALIHEQQLFFDDYDMIEIVKMCGSY